MRPTVQDLAAVAGETGFLPGTIEKVVRLMSLLDGFNAHPFLRSRLALKGGTAINLFSYDVPRLSVDIDLNYIGSSDVEGMRAERPQLERAIQDVCRREDIAVRHVPVDHAGGKWRLAYTDSDGNPGSLELDVNYLLRTPLWPVARAECKPVGPYRSDPVAILDLHELAAGKLAALLARSASRDIFDAHGLLVDPRIDHQRLRLAFVTYGGMNRRDWRTVATTDVVGDLLAMQRDLVPMLRADLAPSRADLRPWIEALVRECRERLSLVLPLAAHEVEFLDRLNDRGEIVPELLTDDDESQALIHANPGLQWKALNVTRRKGEAPEGAEESED